MWGWGGMSLEWRWGWGEGHVLDGGGKMVSFFEGRIFCKTYSISCELTVTL